MAQATQAGTPVIELRHVDKHYGQLHVLKDINLSVKKGDRDHRLRRNPNRRSAAP